MPITVAVPIETIPQEFEQKKQDFLTALKESKVVATEKKLPALQNVTITLEQKSDKLFVLVTVKEHPERKQQVHQELMLLGYTHFFAKKDKDDKESKAKKNKKATTKAAKKSTATKTLRSQKKTRKK